jgi:beta-N-acetylhexosaminidase
MNLDTSPDWESRSPKPPTVPDLPLAERIGGLVLTGFDGPEATGPILDFIAGTAGVVLFARNLVSSGQTAALNDRLRAAFAARGAAPPVIAVDQEGGPVARLDAFGTALPSAMALGAANDVALTAQVYGVAGEELAALGFTLDLAPVADVNRVADNPAIGIRSFGSEPAAVARHVAATVRGLHAAGVHAAAKHFPGHGATAVDSHEDLPVTRVDPARLRAIEFEPFRAAIREGADVIMTAHIAAPGVEASGTPATLSRPFITGLLRDELGFDGVICTDCLEMKAIAARWTPGESAVAAIAAGADLALFSSSTESARAAVSALRGAVESGRLEAAQVERSLERVGRLRTTAGARRPDIAAVGSAAHRRIAQEASARSITIVRDPLSVLPLRLESGDKIFLVQFVDEASAPAATGGKHSTSFGRALAAGPARVAEQIRSLEPAGHEYKQLLMAAASADAIVAVTRRAVAHPLQARAVGDLALAGKPVIVVAAREPYDALIAPPDAAVVATYGDGESSLAAAAAVILGEKEATGSLPVDLGALESEPKGAQT